MKYRIRYEGHRFKVEWRYKYWPFWELCQKIHPALGQVGAYFSTAIEASDFITECESTDKLAKRTWEVVK